jgi:hypothetical protein
MGGKRMSRYNSNWGSHDQLQELRKMGMEKSRQIASLKEELAALKAELERAKVAYSVLLAESHAARIDAQ